MYVCMYPGMCTQLQLQLQLYLYESSFGSVKYIQYIQYVVCSVIQTVVHKCIGQQCCLQLAVYSLLFGIVEVVVVVVVVVVEVVFGSVQQYGVAYSHMLVCAVSSIAVVFGSMQMYAVVVYCSSMVCTHHSSIYLLIPSSMQYDYSYSVKQNAVVVVVVVLVGVLVV